MFMEVEQGATLGDIKDVLRSLAVEFGEESEVLSGFFEESNCHFVFKCDSLPEDLVVEGAQVNWSVGLRGAFHYRANNLHSSWLDIVHFMRSYSHAQPCRFVLSFHYETIYAIRDEGGLKFVGPMNDHGEVVG